MVMMPTKKEAIAEMATTQNGIVSLRLLKNISPPLSPELINKKNSPRNTKNKRISPIDCSPK